MATGISLATEANTVVLDDGESPWNVSGMDILYCVIAVLGIVGNGLVLYVFFKVPQLRVTTNILISHQSLIDFISSFLLPLTFIPPERNLATLYRHNRFLASFVCKVWYSKYLFWTLIQISTINLVLLTLERYFAVLRSRRYRKLASTRNLVLACAFAWLLGATIEVYFPIIHEVGEDGDCSSHHIDPVKRKPIGYMALFTTLLIPTFVMVFVYASIIRFLRRREATLSVYKGNVTSSKNDPTSVSASESDSRQRHIQTHSQTSSPLMTRNQYDVRAQAEYIRMEEKDAGASKFDVTFKPSPKTRSMPVLATRDLSSNEQSAVRNAKKKKHTTSADVASRNILITMFIVCVTYIVCWTPDILLYWHHTIVRFHDWNQLFHRFAILLAFGNVCTNPIIYTLKYRSFQSGLKTVFGRQPNIPTRI